MFHPLLAEPQLVIQNLAIPGITTGPVITPGNNTYGTYTQLLSGAQVTNDAHGLFLHISGIGVSATAKDAIAKLGVDPAGGTSYTDTILHLGCASAGNIGVSGGCCYYFPLRITAGSSIALAVSVNNATVGTASAFIQLFCKPKYPELVRAGGFVRTFGATPASSTGTAITPGSGAKSSYVQLGSATAEPLWWWGMALGINNSVMNNNPWSMDLAVGDATTKRIIIPDQQVFTNTLEVITFTTGRQAQVASGDLVYSRIAVAGTPATGISAIAYGVGG